MMHKIIRKADEKIKKWIIAGENNEELSLVRET
jgi:hypothetical protein